ncbi:MAG: heavy metal sensor histidine kinase [Rubrivivax sp.]|nr:heavy metal sensor histidine kinase [Rubrivivax sp.]
MTTCPPSIGRHLSWCLARQIFVGLALLSVVIYSATSMRFRSAQQDMLADKTQVLSEFIRIACLKGEDELLYKLTLFDQLLAGNHLELSRGDGTLMHRDRRMAPFPHSISKDFAGDAPLVAGGQVRGRLEVDVSHDARMLNGLAVTLLLTSLVGAGLSGLAMRWLVRRDLQPLNDLAAQTRAISVKRLDQRLRLDKPALELLPWIEQFNALMDRLERAYAQLEGFNADVAHELRTPLATLIGQTELALSRERSTESLRETLASNLEEMQRMAALVNDMLFLSQADRGAVARRGEPVSLAALAQQVAEFHEATLEDAGLRLQVEGDAMVAVDEPLFKRAVSNLLGNATRFAERGSTVLIRIAPQLPEQVEVVVQNQGAAIEAGALPRLFDRFFRADSSRCCEEQQHHGLGLAIVAAIARMHAGHTVAESDAGVTRVGFTLARAA